MSALSGPAASTPSADVLSTPLRHGSTNGRPSAEGHPDAVVKSDEFGGHVSTDRIIWLPCSSSRPVQLCHHALAYQWPRRDADAAWRSEQRSCRELCNQKHVMFWRTKVCRHHASCGSRSTRWWVVAFHHRQRQSTCATYTVLFWPQGSCVCTATDDAPPPTFTPAPVGCSLSALCPLSIADITATISQLLNKQCAIDSLPTHLLNDNVDLLASFVTTLFNKSVMSGTFPTKLKTAVITPQLEKASLDFGRMWPTVILTNIQLVGAVFDLLAPFITTCLTNL